MALSACSGTIAPSAVLACIVLAATSAAAQPGTGGEIGPVSRASIGISLSVAPRIQADRTQHVVDGTNKGETFCIWSNASIRTFSVRAVPEPGAPRYVIERGAGGRGMTVDGDTELAGLRALSSANCSSSSGTASLVVASAAKSVGGAPQSSEVLLLIAPD